MKIIIFNSVFYPTNIGGAEKSVYNLATALVRNGYEVAVCSIDENAVGLEKKVLENGVVCYYLKDRNFYWPFNQHANFFLKVFQKILDLFNFMYLADIYKIFDDFKPDVVHTNNLKGISVVVWKIAKKRNCKLVHTLRDYYLQCSKCSKRSNNINCDQTCSSCYLYSTPKRILSNHVDHVVGISKFILDSHLKDNFFQNSERSVIYNSIKLNSKEPVNKAFLNREIVFGYIGRIEKDKGVELLLEQLSKMTVSFNFRLVVAGRGDPVLEEQILKSDFVDYIGYIEPEVFFSKIDYLIVPSLWHEPMGRVIIEAYACGVPVLANQVGGLVELIDDGKTGVITDVNDINRFNTDIIKLVTTNYLNLSNSCLVAAKKYTDEPMIEAYINVYGNGEKNE